MKYGIGHLSVVPCRAEPSDRSEQTTQLLFGETIKVYESRGSWFRIKTAHDNYECWIDKQQFTFITQRKFEELNSKSTTVVADLVEVLKQADSGQITTVIIGSNLPDFKDNSILVNGEKWLYDGGINKVNDKAEKQSIAEYAFLYLNSPYQWGGRSPFGIDCSGFVQIVYKLCGVKLPRDASQQALKGQALSFIEEADEGDLAFFDNEAGDITHVGIILANNRIIHASGKVRIDKLDHQGIFNQENRDYSHRLRLISKIF